MSKYILRRLLINIPVFFGITLMVFTFANLAPGDPLLAMMDPDLPAMDAQTMQALQRRFGLDKPIPVRYLIWLNQVLHGNLGYSFGTRQPIAYLIGLRFPATLQLMASAVFLSVALGGVLGIISALKQYSLLDYMVTISSFIWVSVPGFFAGLAAIYVLAVKLGLLPAFGLSTYGARFPLLDRLEHLLLPATVLGLEGVASFTRYTRSSLLEVLRQDYMTTARSKGLAEHVVILRHGLRNALIPLITIIGLSLPRLFGGSVIIEMVFTWPGMGLLYIQAVTDRDYPLIMGLAFFSANIVLLSNLLADIAYAYMDPRIRYQ